MRPLNRTAVFLYTTALFAALGLVASPAFSWAQAIPPDEAGAISHLDAAVVYYGGFPATETLSGISAPVLGLYGGNDARVNATIPEAQAEMNRLDKSYEVNIFDGAGHGFLRQQSGQEGANMRASREAWSKTLAFFRTHLGG
jgi:carboxymethylenebutenolidase